MRWDKKDIPHKGWIEIGMEDLGEEAEFGDEIQYEQCEMCGDEKIRYVHIMKHLEFQGELRVGCICACHMTDDYESPQARERELRNRVQRKKNFMKREWRQVIKTGNYTLKYKGSILLLCVVNMVLVGVLFMPGNTVGIIMVKRYMILIQQD